MKYFFSLIAIFIMSAPAYAEQSFTIDCTGYEGASIFLDGRDIGVCDYSEGEPHKTVDVAIPDKLYELTLLRQVSTYWDLKSNNDFYVPRDSDRTQSLNDFYMTNRQPRKALLDKLAQRDTLFSRVDDTLLHDSFLGLLWADNNVMQNDEVTLSDADNFCEGYVYKEYENWRLPSRSELASLISYYPGRTGGIETAGKTKPLKYWIKPRPLTFGEKVTFEKLNPHFMDFKSGEIDIAYSKSSHMAALCVHDAQDKKTNWLTKEQDIVVDRLNNIIWQDQPNVALVSMDVEESIHYCNALVIGKQEYWRLPRLSELLSIVDNNEKGLEIDKVFAARATGDDYMSGTRIGSDANYMLSSDGVIDLYNLNSDRSGYVRCVKDIKK